MLGGPVRGKPRSRSMSPSTVPPATTPAQSQEKGINPSGTSSVSGLPLRLSVEGKTIIDSIDPILLSANKTEQDNKFPVYPSEERLILLLHATIGFMKSYDSDEFMNPSTNSSSRNAESNNKVTGNSNGNGNDNSNSENSYENDNHSKLINLLQLIFNMSKALRSDICARICVLAMRSFLRTWPYKQSICHIQMYIRAIALVLTYVDPNLVNAPVQVPGLASLQLPESETTITTTTTSATTTSPTTPMSTSSNNNCITDTETETENEIEKEMQVSKKISEADKVLKIIPKTIFASPRKSLIEQCLCKLLNSITSEHTKVAQCAITAFASTHVKEILLKNERYFYENNGNGTYMQKEPYIMQLVSVLRSVRDSHWHPQIKNSSDFLLEQLIEIL